MRKIKAFTLIALAIAVSKFARAFDDVVDKIQTSKTVHLRTKTTK